MCVYQASQTILAGMHGWNIARPDATATKKGSNLVGFEPLTPILAVLVFTPAPSCLALSLLAYKLYKK